ncbi:MAG: SCO family protein [Bdellovibrionaceae bacterium]|nr:SCO family protein [Pseudobdellovibrionaceae bacterium]
MIQPKWLNLQRVLSKLGSAFLLRGVFFFLFLPTFFVAQVSRANESDKAAVDASKSLTASDIPKEIEGVGITEKLGQKIDLNLPVIDETGEQKQLGSFFDGKTPVILSPVYFSCPGLCNFHLNGLTEGLHGVDWNAGQKFRVLAVSFDSKETPEVARGKKARYMKVYNRPGTEDGWHFLTLSEGSVKTLMESVGFRFKWNEENKEWAHASAAIIVTPDGVISRYLPGIVFEPRDVKLALNEATEGKIGNFIEGLVLYCFQYNPHASKYTIAAINVMKLGGALMVLMLGLWLLPVWVRTKREQKTAGS